jgi:hypothetical protein
MKNLLSGHLDLLDDLENLDAVDDDWFETDSRRLAQRRRHQPHFDDDERAADSWDDDN